MAQFAPHYNLFKIINALRSFLTVAFWGILIVSIIPFIVKYVGIDCHIDDILNIANIIFLFFYFFIDIIIEFILIPQADGKRRDDFLDNSFGSNFALQSSVGYFDNDEVAQGIYKAAVNLFENCFFTHSLIKYITIRKIVLPLCVLLIVAVFAYIGFKDAPIALSVLQALFSATILGGLIKHLILIARLNTIEKDWVFLFQDPAFKTRTVDYAHHVYRNWLSYESLHSKLPAEIPGSIYNKLNPKLTADWQLLKTRFNIS